MGAGFLSIGGGLTSALSILSHTPGEDGPSQMALEDLAMFRSIPTATIFYPSDGVSTEKAVELAANTKVGHMAVCDVGVGGQHASAELVLYCPTVVSPDHATGVCSLWK